MACICFVANSCKKEGHELNRSGGTGKFSKAFGKLIGSGGNSISSVIACGIPIGTTKNIMTDFGATGDGVTDDSPAFLMAADWINANWSPSSTLELYIPTGVYRVGVQLTPGSTYPYGSGTLTNPSGPQALGFDMLKLKAVKNVYIHGDPGLTSQILYKDNMYYGGMSSPGVPCEHGALSTPCNVCTGGSYATVGIFLSLYDCSCITVEDLNLDGNAQNCQLMGHFSDCNGYQIPYDGIFIQNGGDITISNTDCKNFGRDGIMTHYSSSNPTNITLDHLNCISNCRQGFSFTAGDNINATDCKFNSTGSIFYNNPGSGMDIEPSPGATCINSTFTNCEFKNNAFVGMTSDGHGTNVSGIAFNNCEFSATVKGSWSIWPNKMSNTTFSYCTIRGQFTHVAGISITDPLIFTFCNITDWNGSLSNPVSGWNDYLMNFGAGPPTNQYYIFGWCNFDIHHSLLMYSIAGSTAPSYTDRMFGHCNFTFHYSDMISSISYYGVAKYGVGYNSSGLFQYPSLGNFINCYLEGNQFTETAPVSTIPSGVVYWVGICISGCGTGHDSYSFGNNSFPQDGVGGNPYTRVCYNPSWPSSYSWVRGTF